MPENKSDKLDDEIKNFFASLFESSTENDNSESDEHGEDEYVLDTSGYEEGLRFLKSANCILEKYAEKFDGSIAENESLYSIPQEMIEMFPKVLKNVLAYEVYLDVH